MVIQGLEKEIFPFKAFERLLPIAVAGDRIAE